MLLYRFYVVCRLLTSPDWLCLAPSAARTAGVHHRSRLHVEALDLTCLYDPHQIPSHIILQVSRTDDQEYGAVGAAKPVGVGKKNSSTSPWPTKQGLSDAPLATPGAGDAAATPVKPSTDPPGRGGLDALVRGCACNCSSPWNTVCMCVGR
jgi:hypothetical protein